MYGLDPRVDGSFNNSDMSAGSYDVEVSLRNGGRLAVIPRVLVEDGQTTRDPRAQQIDLSAALHRVRVRVSLPDGTPATRGTVCVLQHKVRSYSHVEYEIRDGVAELLLHEDAPDLAVLVEGFCVVRLARVDGDRDVVLRESAIEVDLVLPRTIELPSSGRLMLTLSVAREDRDKLGMWWQPLALAFDESRELHASFQLPGTYALEFRLDGSPRDEPGIAGASRLTIDASSAGRTIEVEPDPVAYARALGR